MYSACDYPRLVLQLIFFYFSNTPLLLYTDCSVQTSPHSLLPNPRSLFFFTDSHIYFFHIHESHNNIYSFHDYELCYSRLLKCYINEVIFQNKIAFVWGNSNISMQRISKTQKFKKLNKHSATNTDNSMCYDSWSVGTTPVV